MANKAGQLVRLLPPPARRILGPLYRLRQALRSHRTTWRERTAVETDASGLPLPPPCLRSLVSGWSESGDWLRSGEVDAGLIRGLVEGHGVRLEEMTALLDFGCGCDYNNLFSHLRDEEQRAWLEEVRRGLKPGGLFLFTVMGARFLGKMDEAERRCFSKGELVVRKPELSGTNACSVLHPPRYVREVLLPRAGFELLEYVDEDRSGQERSVSPLPLQDNYLVRVAEA